MALTARDIIVNADAFRAAYPHWPHPEPERGTDMDWQLIHSYSRAQAIADGTLAEVPAGIAAEAGWTCHVAMTRAAWEDCVAWDEADNARKGSVQDEAGRLWDVVWMSSRFAKGKKSGRALFPVHRVPRTGRAIVPRKVILAAVAGPGDAGELTITIMQVDES
jgi:hypothetical protein